VEIAKLVVDCLLAVRGADPGVDGDALGHGVDGLTDCGIGKRKARARLGSRAIGSRMQPGLTGIMRARCGGRKPVGERTTMTPTNNGFDQRLINLIADAIQSFLRQQRRIQRSDDWFSVDKIAAELKLGSLRTECLFALLHLNLSGKLETSGARCRHI